MNIEYPVWKKVAWEFARSFFATLFVELAVTLPLLKEPTDIKEWWTVVVVPVLVASLRSVGEYLRKTQEGNYNSISYKLPV